MTTQYVHGMAVDNDSLGQLVHDATARAGEEMPESATLSIHRVTEDWKYLRCAAGTGEQLVFAGSCRLGPIHFDVATLGAYGTLTLRDAAATGGGSAAIAIIQTTTSATISATLADLKGLRFTNGLTVQFSTTGAGCTVGYREADFS